MNFLNGKKRCGSIRGTAAVLSACVCLGLTAAPFSAVYAQEGEDAQGSALGRYVEQELETPDIRIYDVAVMPDGRLRLLGRAEEKDESGRAPYEMWDSTDGGAGWEKAAVLSEEVSDRDFMDLKLAPDGGGAGIAPWMPEESGELSWEYYSFDADGTAAQIPVAEDAGVLQRFCFGSQGELIGQGSGTSAFQISRETGEIVQEFGGPGDHTDSIGVCGQELLMLSGSEAQRFDLASGEPLPYDESLNAQLFADGTDYMVTSSGSVHIVFGYTDDGRMYYSSAGGIFAHVQGGSVVEQLVDGGMCSLSEPGTGLLGMAVSGEDFYVACLKGEETTLLKYVYSADTPTVPEKEVTVYSLEENREIRQAAVMYQNAHPDVQISYVTGLSGEDGITVSDALRTLNTDIMAGSGPDVLVLDGMPADSYIEKGVLADISGIRDAAVKASDLFAAMTSAWEKDGTVYALPIRFKMPLLAGESELVGQAEDLTRLSDLIESAAGDTETCVLPAFNALLPDAFLYSVCAGAWRNEDGTVNEEKLLDYITQVKRIRDSQISRITAEEIDACRQNVEEQGSRMLSYMALDELAFLRGARLSFGEAGGIHEINFISSVNRQMGNLAFAPLRGQQSGVFVPVGIVGVSSMASDLQSAEAFVEFLFTDEAQTQSVSDGDGLPVSRNAFLALLHEKEPGALGDSSAGTEDPATGEAISLDEYWMTQEEMDQLVEDVEKLDVAADTDTMLMDAVLDRTGKCLEGECSPEEAVSAVIQTMNLYLAEI